MSGHFVLNNISNGELTYVTGIDGVDLSGLEHAGVGWNPASRATLTDGLAGNNIVNRAGLPPHRYIRFGGVNLDMQRVTNHLLEAHWVRDMVIPPHPSFRPTALSANARAMWGGGNKPAALMRQIEHGDTSVEVYHRNGQEMA